MSSTTDREDLGKDVVARLADDALDPEAVARVERMARRALVVHGERLTRFDELTFGRVLPTVLIVVGAVYATGLVGFFRAMF